MKKLILLLTAIAAVAIHANAQTTTNLDYFTTVTFPAGYAVGDYVEFLKASPISAGASGNYEISITYTRGNIAAAATFWASISHSNPALWREVGKVNSNKYGGSSANFTVDCNTEYGNSRFRIRAIATGGTVTDALPVAIRVRSVNYNSGWTALSVTGNDLTVNKFLPMTDEWSLYTGTPYSANGANLAIKALANGFVGMGTSAPQAQLHLHSATPTLLLTPTDPTATNAVGAIRGSNYTWLFGYGGASGSEDISIGTQDGAGSRTLTFATGGFARARILANGNMLIGETTQANNAYKLDVNGAVRANKIVVNATGADFVFEKGYHLPSLDSVEQYVKANRHLPGIAPAADMQKEGMEVGEQQTKLLQKIEELTLYLIEEHKKQEELMKTVAEQKKQIQQLQERIESKAVK